MSGRGSYGPGEWREDDRDDWERGRGSMRGEQSRYERGGFFGGSSGYGGYRDYGRSSGRGEMSSGRQYERDWSEGGGGGGGGGMSGSRSVEYDRPSDRGYRDRDWSESSFGPSTMEGTSGFGPGVGPRGTSQRGRSTGYGTGYYGEYGGYGVSPSGYGPSTGYGYGPSQNYIGDQGQISRWRGSSQGSFMGRGPKNYKRSDERIREDVNERLTRHPDIDASDIEVRVANCEVVLTGVVEDRRAKRLAEDIAEDVWGVDDVKNELKVRHGFLAGLTGEKADDRDVTQPAVREGTSEESSRKTGRTSTTTAPTTGT